MDRLTPLMIGPPARVTRLSWDFRWRPPEDVTDAMVAADLRCSRRVAERDDRAHALLEPGLSGSTARPAGPLGEDSP